MYNSIGAQRARPSLPAFLRFLPRVLKSLLFPLFVAFLGYALLYAVLLVTQQ